MQFIDWVGLDERGVVLYIYSYDSWKGVNISFCTYWVSFLSPLLLCTFYLSNKIKKEAMLTFFQREINEVPFLKILCGFAQLSFDVPCSFLVYSPNSSWQFKSLF